MTPNDLIRIAMKNAGVLATGENALPEDYNDIFIMLNAMLAQWTQQRWLVYHLVDVFITSTGAQSYTVGVGGDFNIVRPDRIQKAYVRMNNQGLSNPTDYSLMQLEAHEDYIDISLKSLVSFPSAIFYDATPHLGTVYIWPIPSSKFDIHLLVKENLTQFVDQSSPITLPLEYLDALIWNLAGRIQLMYQIPVSQGIVGLAVQALGVIRTANSRIPNLTLPAGLGRGSGGWSGHGLGGPIEGAFTFDETGMT